MTSAGADQATADDFLRRQLVLTWVSGVVVLVVVAATAIALFLTNPVDPPSPEDLRRSYRAFTVVAVVGAVALTTLLAVLLRHAIGLARFVFRKEVRA